MYWIPNHPFPFPLELASEWIEKELKLTEEIFAAFAEGIWRPAKGSPLKVIRELIHSESGASQRDIYVGDVDFRHGHWWSKRLTPIKGHWEDWRDKERVWSIGGELGFIFFRGLTDMIIDIVPYLAMLKSSYHNRGIGSVAISTLFNQWGIPQIGCTEVRAGTYVSNIASNRLWEKLGFAHSGQLDGTVIVQKEKIEGEENREEKVQTLIWSLP